MLRSWIAPSSTEPTMPTASMPTPASTFIVTAPPFGKLLRDEADRRRPEEALADAVERRRRQDRHACRDGQAVQTDGRDACAQRQQSERREAMHERAGEQPQHEHQRGCVDEHPARLQAHAHHFGFQERGDPAVRAELGRGERHHDEQHDDEQQPARRARVERVDAGERPRSARPATPSAMRTRGRSR